MMAIDVQQVISDVMAKAQENPEVLTQLATNPVGVIEQLTGIDLPDEQVNAVVDGIKAKAATGIFGEDGKPGIDDLVNLAGGFSR